MTDMGKKMLPPPGSSGGGARGMLAAGWGFVNLCAVVGYIVAATYGYRLSHPNSGYSAYNYADAGSSSQYGGQYGGGGNGNEQQYSGGSGQYGGSSSYNSGQYSQYGGQYANNAYGSAYDGDGQDDG
eukprot:CAMPEP_0194271200 /NCGR_PEP_ID=MMETSP0169-20130528/5048_1 /TAXON_ID=218684 /ORGANISM="Corethron pennatum, Strain L29A3" /LENGTH=126 /DNA_ID=CAMNT_0039013493 /DNA_START=472 /DNA_END=848 /DNA_ORIENTATION=+